MEINQLAFELMKATRINSPKAHNERESQLATQLKLICDRNGKELDFKKSAPIFHELGNEYQRKTPDMFSLIKSAALYNAAIARSPDNVKEIENDLNHLCKHILQAANAKHKDADLVAKSKQLKQRIMNWREQVDYKLPGIQQIPDDINLAEVKELEEVKIYDVKRLQNQITENYIDIMAEIAKYCEHLLGDAPFAFAIAGMGSLARKEITPYSDFEHIILLSNAAKLADDMLYESKLNYYRWFTVIFQVVIINLQETLLPSVAVFCLNDVSSRHGNWFYDSFTTRGISFDGMMVHACKFPLGRQQQTKDKPWKTELIKTVDEMLNYLSSEESLKNGYHLSDILTKTCYIYKDKSIFDEFQNAIFCKLKSGVRDENVKEEIKKQVADDLKNFATRSTVSKLKFQDKLNVKQVVYRSTTLFISAIAKMYNIPDSSSFDIVEELWKKDIISDYAKHKLMYAIALACEIRLKWYMANKRQCDVIVSDLSNQRSAVTILLQIVGKASTMKYFQIAYALQCDTAKRLNLQKNFFYTDPHLFN